MENKSPTYIDLESLKKPVEITSKVKLTPRSQLACKMQGILLKEVKSIHICTDVIVTLCPTERI